MGTKNCPEAPRQKMISVMYLVLTAMLALNVDKSVLEAFAMVDHSFMETIQNFTSKNQRVYSDFSAAAKENPQKAGVLNEKVLKVKASSDSLYNYILSLKELIVKTADGPEGNINEIVSQQDLHVAALVMIAKKNGTVLKKAIEAYRNSLIASIDTSNTELIAALNKSLSTAPPPPKEGNSPSWEESKFEGYPLIAVITLMSKMQSDVRNAESDVINNLYAKIDASSFKFNKLQAQVVSKSDFVLLGGTYEANVFLSAVDTTVSPEVFVGGTKLSNTLGDYKVSTSREGKIDFIGYINYKTPSGTVVPYPFKHSYEVAKPSMTVSPTKMNVFYAGLANPVSISVPGIAPSNVKVSITNGTIAPGTIAPGIEGYIVSPSKVGVNSIITVSAMIDGTEKVIGSTEFRVKKVPDPVASVAGKTEGIISKNELMAQLGVMAKIPDFDFQMNFTVTSFVVSTIKASYVVDEPTKGNRFSTKQVDLMKSLSSGSRLYIESIVVKGDDGSVRNLPAISFKIN